MIATLEATATDAPPVAALTKLTIEPENPIAPAAFYVGEIDLTVRGGKFDGMKIAQDWLAQAAGIFAKRPGVSLRIGHPDGFPGVTSDRGENSGAMIWPGALTTLVYIPEFGRPKAIATQELINPSDYPEAFEEVYTDYYQRQDFGFSESPYLNPILKTALTNLFDWDPWVEWKDLPFNEMYYPTEDMDGDDVGWMTEIYNAKEEAWNEAKELEAAQAAQAEQDAKDAAELVWFGLGDKVVAAFNRKMDLLESGDLTAFQSADYEDSSLFWADFMEAHDLFEDEETVEAYERMKNLEQRTRRHFELLAQQRQAAKGSALTGMVSVKDWVVPVAREQGKGFGGGATGGVRKGRK